MHFPFYFAPNFEAYQLQSLLPLVIRVSMFDFDRYHLNKVLILTMEAMEDISQIPEVIVGLFLDHED